MFGDDERAGFQSGLGGCFVDQALDGLITVERLSRPVLADFTEEAMFDGIPLRSTRRIVSHSYGDGEGVGQL